MMASQPVGAVVGEGQRTSAPCVGCWRRQLEPQNHPAAAANAGTTERLTRWPPPAGALHPVQHGAEAGPGQLDSGAAGRSAEQSRHAGVCLAPLAACPEHGAMLGAPPARPSAGRQVWSIEGYESRATSRRLAAAAARRQQRCRSTEIGRMGELCSAAFDGKAGVRTPSAAGSRRASLWCAHRAERAPHRLATASITWSLKHRRMVAHLRGLCRALQGVLLAACERCNNCV